MVFMNTLFQKRGEHLATYRSGGDKSQIDFFLVREEHRRSATDVKVIPGEAVAHQHRLLVPDWRTCHRKPTKREHSGKRKIKVWKLKENAGEYANYVRTRMEQAETNLWPVLRTGLVEGAIQLCGKTSGKQKADKETWWWSAEVQGKIKEKKDPFKEWQVDRENQGKRDTFKEKKKEAKKAVTEAKDQATKEWYEQMGIPEGEKRVYKVARQRATSRRSTPTIKVIKDKDGNILVEEKAVKKRWEEYFQNLLNETNPAEELEVAPAVEGPIQTVTIRDVDEAIRKMKTNKAPGPSEVALEMIKALGPEGVGWTHKMRKKI